MLHRLPTLFMFARGQTPEISVQGIVALRELDGDTYSNAPTSLKFVSRSLLKPWQYLASDVGDTSAFWTLGFASHSAQPPQIEALQALCSFAQVTESDLICPRSWPLDAGAATAMRIRGESQTRLLHPCSGKHLTMLAACRHHDMPITNYFSPDHPLQKKIYNLVGREASERLEWLIDSCGLPVAAMSVDGYLKLWDRLAKSTDPRSDSLKDLWLQNPRLVGGLRRLDSDIMEALPGRVLAKEGADGLLVVHTIPTATDEVLATCFIKITAGYNPAHLGLALSSLLHQRAMTGTLTHTLKDLADYLETRHEEWIPSDQSLLMPPFNQMS